MPQRAVHLPRHYKTIVGQATPSKWFVHQFAVLEIEMPRANVLGLHVVRDTRLFVRMIKYQRFAADCDIAFLAQSHPKIVVLCTLEFDVKTTDIS